MTAVTEGPTEGPGSVSCTPARHILLVGESGLQRLLLVEVITVKIKIRTIKLSQVVSLQPSFSKHETESPLLSHCCSSTNEEDMG